MASVNPVIKWHGTTAQRMTVTAVAGVIGYDTTLKMLCMFDGTTAGGILLDDNMLSQLSSSLSDSQKNTINRKLDVIRTGMEMVWASNTIPYGWLLEDGQTTYSKVTNPEFTNLYNWLNTNMPACIVDANTFKTPDMRNLIVRAKGNATESVFTTVQAESVPNATGDAPFFGSNNMIPSGSFVQVGDSSNTFGSGTGRGRNSNMDLSRSSASFGRRNEVAMANVCRNYIIKW